MVCSLFDSTSAVLRMAETLGKAKKHCETQLDRYNPAHASDGADSKPRHRICEFGFAPIGLTGESDSPS